MWRGSEGVWLTQDALERRASARRRYNAWRQFVALFRRCKVIKMLAQGYTPSMIAAVLDVSPSTIRRDRRMAMHEGRDVGRCPTCQRQYNPVVPQGY